MEFYVIANTCAIPEQTSGTTFETFHTSLNKRTLYNGRID